LGFDGLSIKVEASRSVCARLLNLTVPWSTFGVKMTNSVIWTVTKFVQMDAGFGQAGSVLNQGEISL
jgi:hypothetical protein